MKKRTKCQKCNSILMTMPEKNPSSVIPWLYCANENCEQDRQDKQRLKMRNTKEGRLLWEMGYDYYDTESSARRVAEFAVEEISKLAEAIHYPHCWDTVNYPTLLSALKEIGCNPELCTKHNWKCISPGEYDSLYECVKCGKQHMDSIDNPEHKFPDEDCLS